MPLFCGDLDTVFKLALFMGPCRTHSGNEIFRPLCPKFFALSIPKNPRFSANFYPSAANPSNVCNKRKA